MFVAVLSFSKDSQLVVPVGLERIGNQSIRGVHLHISATSEIDFILCPLDLLAAQAIDIFVALLNLLPNGKRHLDGHGGHGLDHKLADGRIDAGAWNDLTCGLCFWGCKYHALVIGDELFSALVIADRHAATAQPTDGAALEQGGTFPRRTVAAVRTIGLSRIAQALGDVLRSLSKKKMYGSPNSNPSPELGADKENHTSWERYYQVSDCSSSLRNDWYSGI